MNYANFAFFGKKTRESRGFRVFRQETLGNDVVFQFVNLKSREPAGFPIFEQLSLW